ncbi:DUF397 domain-containing protein [Kitasatospora sp. NRRL B-11411]|uniref:DUF397 domain-containing protein n=1 Tax=Kitasatospora sp. NRRL B-11411 TaxID=1463822 RepID=UPI0007C4F5A6|nr:DUF397 domain-containing protein [Kitasatospora sp. NRRL B-11411]
MNTTDLDAARLDSELAEAAWQTASSGGTNCVEVTFLRNGMVAFRDSLNPEQPPLLITDEGFSAFTVAIMRGALRRPTPLDADPVTATTKNDVAPDWLAAQLADARWHFTGPESIEVAFLPRAITAFRGPNSGPDSQVLIFADSEISDFYEGVRCGIFRRQEDLTLSPASHLELVH